MTGKIYFFSEEIDFQYEYRLVASKWLKAVIHQENLTFDTINIIFCSDEYLWSLNTEFLNHDTYTDIITFQYQTSPISGDLYISIPRVSENAKKLNISFQDELHRVIVHGVLHLCGYKDKREEEILVIRTKEDFYLNKWQDFRQLSDKPSSDLQNYS